MAQFLKPTALAIALCLGAVASPVLAQDATEQEEQQTLKVYFPLGSAQIAADQSTTIDLAARTFREGDPFVMILSGSADTVGDPATNLNLSLRRASAVAQALSARGIPVGRLQVLGRGTSELEVVTDAGVAEAENRVVEISWR